MTRTQYTNHLLNILAFDAIIQHLSIACRYWLHREIVTNSKNVIDEAIVSTASSHIMQLSETIINNNWQRPELRYNSDRELEYLDGLFWKKFNPKDHV
ncbi:hypothetical protein BN863_28930 [Formosa agariphila KMM 3901]|uniref:Uncharacterized protein n=1 Tax=Formosa agariphila (strain DSM 15362 / KCTC 12365 / LMG 23005 / KMM 3901 / M-2Alg 35-1) TaxID=1347342 RepID=T2KPB7_FORAG|nr:hypothetical protein [Formosa agariphila]CDF80605.1 hypothetical protein BN863_28930 [Formosa agariphila KMM 3901]